MKRKKRSKRKAMVQDIPQLEALEQINFNAAGLDVGDDEIYVAVPEGRDCEVRAGVHPRARRSSPSMAYGLHGSDHHEMREAMARPWQAVRTV